MAFGSAGSQPAPAAGETPAFPSRMPHPRHWRWCKWRLYTSFRRRCGRCNPVGSSRTRLPLTQNVFGAGIIQLAWSPDDQVLALGSEVGTGAVLRSGCRLIDRNEELKEMEQCKVPSVAVLDRTGMSASLACAVHCAVFP